MAAKKKKPTEKREQDVKREPFRQKLPVVLKAPELADRAQRAAHKLQDHDAKLQEFKEQAKENKIVVERLASEHRELSRVVREGKEFRDVPCERIYNWTDGSVKDVRTDTGEVIAERGMSEAERQKSLPFPPAESSDDLDDEFGGSTPDAGAAEDTEDEGDDKPEGDEDKADPDAAE